MVVVETGLFISLTHFQPSEGTDTYQNNLSIDIFIMYLDIMNHSRILSHTCFPGIIALTAFCDENLEVGTKKVQSKRMVVL